MDNINIVGLPEKYEVIRSNEDTTKYGILYRSPKKEEVIVEPKYSVCTAFKALGKIFIAYFVDGDGEDDLGYYVIRNRKGDLQTDMPVYDFVACNKILYVQIMTERGMELVALDKELQIIKSFGVKTFSDYYTSNGNRVIPNTRQTLEVKDKDGGLCRINLTDHSLDSVISFSANALTKNNHVVEDSIKVEDWTYEVNLSKGTITKHDGFNGHISIIASIADLEKYLSDVVVLFDSTPEIIENEVQVKRHMETYKIVKFVDIPNERAVMVDKILKSVLSGGTFELIHELLAYLDMNCEEVLKYLTDDFNAFYSKNDQGLKTEYSAKIVTLTDKAIFMVKTDRNKIYHLIEDLDKFELLDKCVYTLDMSESEVAVKDTVLSDTKEVPKPKKHKAKSNSYYARTFAVDGVFNNKEYSEDESKAFSFMLFDKFTYGPLVKDDTKKTVRHNFNDSNIVLTTTTSDVYLMLI